MKNNIRITIIVAGIAALTTVAVVPASASIEDSTVVSQPAVHKAISAPDEPEPFVAPPAPDEKSLEVRIFRVLNSGAANPVLDFIMPVVTDFRRSRIVLLLVWAALVLFGGNRGRWAALMLIPLVAATDQLSASVLKPLVGRSRPCEVLGSIHLWYGPEGWITTPAEVMQSYKSSFSFPSSHATNITGAMLFLGLVFRKTLLPLLLVAVLVSYSRVYIGVHWTSDVIVGMAIGALLGWLAWAVFSRLCESRDGVYNSGSDDEDGADGLLDDAGGGAPEEEVSDPM